MIDRRTHNLMALSAVQAYVHAATECMIGADSYAQTIEGGEATAKQIASIHDQLNILYRVGLMQVPDEEGSDGKEDDE